MKSQVTKRRKTIGERAIVLTQGGKSQRKFAALSENYVYIYLP